MSIGHGKKIGPFMKHRNLILSCFFLFALWVFCGNACSPADPKLDCGLYLSYDLPKGADSIQVIVYKDDSILYVAKDTIHCSKCLESNVWIQKDNKNLKKDFDWEYGEYYVEEIAYCNGKKTIFPKTHLTLKKGYIGLVNVLYIDHQNDLFTPYVPVENNCGIDSTYQIHIGNDDECNE